MDPALSDLSKLSENKYKTLYEVINNSFYFNEKSKIFENFINKNDCKYQKILSKNSWISDVYQNVFVNLDKTSSHSKMECNYDNKDLTKRLLKIMREDSFEYGSTPQSELFIKEQFRTNKLHAKNWVNEVYIEYIDDIEILSGLLYIISHIDYNDIYPCGQTIAIAALSHSDIVIQELGIMIFEQWSNSESLKILSNTNVKSEWLKEYLDGVIEDISKKLCLI